MKRRINTSTLLDNWKKEEHEGDHYTNCDWCIWYNNKRITKGTGAFGSWRTIGDHLNNNIIANGQNTEKSPGDLRRTCCRTSSSERASADTTDVKNSNGDSNNNNKSLQDYHTKK